jgi:hypothetical protein
VASWFETPPKARLLTMRVWHLIQEEDLILRSIAKRCVSKDEANEVEIALAIAFSSEVGTGSREENASKQETRARF